MTMLAAWHATGLQSAIVIDRLNERL